MTRFILSKDWLPADGVNLTEEQRNVVDLIDNNVAIIAGPGTGKTEVLAQKATYLLQTGICPPPFKILTLCYKVDAAKNIRERVRKRCPSDLAYRFQSMTADAFMISLVRRFATSLPEWLQIRSDFEVIDEINDIEYRRSLGNKKDSKKELYLYAAKNNNFDYEMCRQMAQCIIKNNLNIKTLLSNTYKYIFLDEFQDMIELHYEAVKLLFCNPNNKVSAVGDYNQAIMGWAGAIPEIFKKFKADFNSVEHQFTYNHRSSPQIVSFINQVVKKLTSSNYAPIEYQSKKLSDSTNSIFGKQFASLSEEALYIAQCINKIKEENPKLNLGDFAIILKQKADEYKKNTEQSFISCNIAVRNEDAKVCPEGLKFKDLMVDDLSNLNIYFLKSKLRTLSIEEQKEFNYILSKTLCLDLDKPKDIKKLHKIKQEILKNNFIDTKTWIDNISNAILEKKICGNLYPNHKSFKEAKTSIIHLFQSCLDNSSGNLSKAIDEYLGVNAVKLMTTHGSKGLEFDTVFFADFNPKSWWTLDKAQQKEESLRCFFVGLSRAKKRIFFTAPTDTWPLDIDIILKDSNMVKQYTL